LSFVSNFLDIVATGDPNAVMAALSRGRSVHERGASQETALHVAAFNGFVVIVNLLLSQGNNIDSCVAAWAIDFVPSVFANDTFLAVGADVNAKDQVRRFSLRFCAPRQTLVRAETGHSSTYCRSERPCGCRASTVTITNLSLFCRFA
jgi:ankyrin repeat protein